MNDTLIGLLKGTGATNVAEINTEDIYFDPSLIELCAMNSCGNYGKNYTCPPLVGDTSKNIEKAKSYKKAVVFQKIYKIEDSFDFEGMAEGGKDFKRLIKTVFDICEKKFNNYLLLGAGGCTLCEKCGAIDGTPCRFPGKAIASLESYSIQVSKLAELAGMKYINGQNTVTYFGAVLYDQY